MKHQWSFGKNDLTKATINFVEWEKLLPYPKFLEIWKRNWPWSPFITKTPWNPELKPAPACRCKTYQAAAGKGELLEWLQQSLKDVSLSAKQTWIQNMRETFGFPCQESQRVVSIGYTEYENVLVWHLEGKNISPLFEALFRAFLSTWKGES